jgi:hypothetical protein
MQSISGVITMVQEGRFRLLTDEGRVLPFMLSHKARVEPQDLPPLQEKGARVRIGYSDDPRLIASVAHRIEVEE